MQNSSTPDSGPAVFVSPAAGSDSRAPVRVLGIDPGYRTTGYGLIEYSNRRACYISSGCFDSSKGSLSIRLGLVFSQVSAVVRQHRPDLVAIEEVFVNRNPASSLKLGQARGAALAAVIDAGIPISEYAATRVKQSVTSHGRAAKEQVAFMVRRLLNLDHQLKLQSDEADALAVALCHLLHSDGRQVWNRSHS